MPITLDEFKRVAATSGNTIAMGIDTPFLGSATITITEVPLVGEIIRLDDSVVNKGDVIDAATLASLRFRTAGPEREGAGTFEYSVVDGPDQATGSVEVHTYSENPSMTFIGDSGGGLEPHRLNADGTITALPDINPGATSSTISASADWFTEFGGQLYFSADDGTDGRELWRIRADNVVEQVMDINTGSAGSSPSQFVVLNDTLYFRAFDTASGSELWRVNADGTAEIAANINTGSTSSSPNGLTLFNNAVYFNANDGTAGNELWRANADGTVELVDDFGAGIAGLSPQFMTEFNGSLYFNGIGSGTGQELFRLTAGGTIELVQDLVVGPFGANPGSFVATSDSLYFTAFNTGFRPNLYRVKQDGTVEDLGETNPGGNSNYLLGAEFNGDFYFRATGPTEGSELWRRKADGTIEQVADIYPGAVTSTTGNSSPSDFTEINGFLYFAATTAANGREVWRVKPDGTVEMVADINVGSGNSVLSPQFIGFGGDVYVLASSNGTNFHTWRIEPDGTTTQLTAYLFNQFGVPVGSPGFVGYPTGIPEGTPGDDVLFGTSADETIAGLAGDDTIAGNAGADMLDGGTGNDTVSYTGSGAAVQIDLGIGSATGGDAAGDTLASIESLIGSAFIDTLTGDGSSNVIEGGASADAIDGGGGSDTASYAASASGVMVFLANGVTASMASGGDAAGDTLVDIESLTGSSQNDILIGNDDANTLNGGGGTDEIGGGNGDDTLIGGDATDVLVGGAGADDLQGGGGFDIAFYLGSPSGVTIDLVAGTGSGGEAQGDTFNSVETIIGSAFDDTITGNAAANTFIGRDGADSFFGSAGGDILIGGNSVAVDTNMSDLVDYSGAATAEVAINLLNNSAQGTDIGVDQLFGIENVSGTAFGDLLRGDDNANTLNGLGGGDLMFGQGGDDTLIGGSDGNVMTGGSGNDDFVFGAADVNSNSIVTDFDQSGDDQLTFTGFGPGFDFADFTLNVVNGSDVNVTAVGWSGSVYLQNAAGLVDAGDFQFA